VRALITGITGFVGSHLADHLAGERPDVTIHGLVRWRSPLDHLRGRLDDLTLHHADLRDLGSLLGVLEAARPDVIFHLAAQSYVPTSFTAPVDTLDVNLIGTTNLLEAVRIAGLDPVVHVCSSSEVYGQVRREDVPIREDCPLQPVSPYGVSKVGADLIADVYHRAHGLRTIRSRMFTHSGPRRGEVFVDSWFALQLARIEAGRQEPVLRVGNLDSVRTFCDVRDTVRAYLALVERGRVGEAYNIGGATTMTIGEMLELLLSFSKHAGSVEIRSDPGLLRPTDVTLQIPCIDKFVADTGWQPEISYPRTLRDMLDYWRERVANGSA
jgi:GDP-mannose 4,6-dehydratase